MNKDEWIDEYGVMYSADKKMKIHVEIAGTLPELIDEKLKYQITELNLSGNLNGTDIRFIREMAGRDKYSRETKGKLAILDIAGANIVSGGNYYVYDSYYKSYLYTENNTIVRMFTFCNELDTIILPENSVVICYDAFICCNSLRKLVISENNSNYTTIDGVLFSKDEKTLICVPVAKTGSYSIPNSVTTIELSAFYYSNLQKIKIPDSVTEIKQWAFNNCKNLKRIVLPDKLTKINNFTFAYCNELTSVTIGDSIREIDVGSFRLCPKLNEFIVSEQNENFSVKDGVLFNKDKTVLICYPSAKESSFYAIPQGVKKIKHYAFESCLNLKMITIPDSIEDICKHAFGEHCSYLDIYIKNPRPVVFEEELFGVPLNEIDKRCCMLYVPKGSSLAYRKSLIWNEFEFIIETEENDVLKEIDESNLLRYTTCNSGHVEILENTIFFQLFDLQGRKIKPSIFSEENYRSGKFDRFVKKHKGVYAVIKAGNRIINQKIIW